MSTANLILTDSVTLEPAESVQPAMHGAFQKEACYQQLCKSFGEVCYSWPVPIQRGRFKVRGQVLFDDIVPGVVDMGIAAEAARQFPFPWAPAKPNRHKPGTFA